MSSFVVGNWLQCRVEILSSCVDIIENAACKIELSKILVDIVCFTKMLILPVALSLNNQ